jgi:hypothetical protein
LQILQKYPHPYSGLLPETALRIIIQYFQKKIKRFFIISFWIPEMSINQSHVEKGFVFQKFLDREREDFLVLVYGPIIISLSKKSLTAQEISLGFLSHSGILIGCTARK